jgi:hypothetical protein
VCGERGAALGEVRDGGGAQHRRGERARRCDAPGKHAGCVAAGAGGAIGCAACVRAVLRGWMGCRAAGCEVSGPEARQGLAMWSLCRFGREVLMSPMDCARFVSLPAFEI